MKKVVVDTSVAVKWFLPEIHSENAIRLLDAELGLCAPDLIGPELVNTLWKRLRRGELTHAEADEIVAVFGRVPIAITPSKALLPAALRIAAALGRTVYDSLYVALAVAQGGLLVTADRKFHQAVMTSAVLAPHVRWVEDKL